MSTFASIALRNNGEKITASWFDALRAAGVTVETFLGGGAISETSVTLSNNTAATAVTGCIVDKTLYKSALVTYAVRRKTSTNEAISVGTLTLIYRDLTTAWDIVDQNSGDEDGVDFTIDTSTGQVKYASDNMSGTGYVGTVKFRMMTFSI